MTDKPAMTPQQAQFSAEKGGAFDVYRRLTVGDKSLSFLAYYELLTLLFANLPGLAGFGLRSLFYPSLFKCCGRRPAIGRSVLLRGPDRISIGKKLMLDDSSVLDVHGDNSEISIGDFVSIGRGTAIVSKGGGIHFGNAVNIGANCRIATQSGVSIGESTLVAAYCYIGPGNHQRGDEETPLIAQDMELKGGITIGKHAWIGTRATILDGVTIGDRAIVGAHSLVREDVPSDSVVAGVPAKLIKSYSST